MSDWWSIIIVILIVIIIFDGFRRARASRKNSIRLSRNARKADKLFDNELKQPNAELDAPVSNVRVKQGQDSVKHSEPDETIETHVIPEQASLELGDPVPMLMESVEADDEPHSPEFQLEPSIGDLDELDRHELPDSQDSESQAVDSEPSPIKEAKTALQKAADYFNREPEPQDNTDTQSAEKESDEDQQLVSSSAEEILVINVMARSGETFNGRDILETLTDLKLKFGQMGIFHRYHDNDGDAASLFSVANIVEPGVFDLSTIDDVNSPGLCMFLPLPSAVPAIEAYENLIETAQNIASMLGGDVKDENRSAMTNQTIEHGRQRVLEFERKYQLRK